jgi:urea transporter
VWFPLQPDLFAAEVLRGTGQVLFLNSPVCGGVVLGALGYSDPWLATLATLGTASATATARTIGIDAGTISSGLAGYNGFLVGGAFSVFLTATNGWSFSGAAAATVVGAACTAPLVGLLRPVCGTVPQFTWAFNATTLVAFGCYVRPLADATAATASASLITLSEFVSSTLSGVAQIGFVGDPTVGSMLLGAMCLYSPSCAAHALVGSGVGVAAALACAAPHAEIIAGLWGYNPALTALAVSVFFVPSPSSYVLAAGGAAASTFLFAATKGVTASAIASPALTLPLCVIGSACHLMHHVVPSLVLAGEPHSPERNEAP